MSTEIGLIKNSGKDGKADLDLTVFYGGDAKGEMIQLTQGFGIDLDEPGFIQLTPRDAYQLIGRLAEWLKDVARGKAADLEKAVERNKDLQKTLVKDAIECERFIAELKIIDVPLLLLGL